MLGVNRLATAAAAAPMAVAAFLRLVGAIARARMIVQLRTNEQIYCAMLTHARNKFQSINDYWVGECAKSAERQMNPHLTMNLAPVIF
jgi:hypothetical protein